MAWLFALDLGEYRVGFCAGAPGAVPLAKTLRLRKSGERTEEAVARFGCWLRDRFEERLPDILCIEGLIPAGAMEGMTTSFVREGQTLLHGAARAIAACYGVPVRAPAMQTIRIHFCGQRSAAPKRTRGYKRSSKEVAADRAATKRMVLDRAILLGYLPRGSVDDDAADAAAVFDYGSAQFFHKGTPFAMFGEKIAGE
jgi:hypothetical protein